MSVLAIIPARGGSKTVPRKNIRMLDGKPLIVHTIQHAQDSRLLTRTIVSTDDPEIAEIARAYGGEAPFLRPAELATDEAPALLAYQHAVRWVETHGGDRPEIIVVLQPTSPLRRPEHIDRAVALVRETGADSVLSLCEAWYTPYNMKRIVDGRVVSFLDGVSISRRQEAPVVYQPNGVVCATRYAVLMAQNRLLGADTRPLIMPVEESINIDTEWDFTMAESCFRARRQHAHAIRSIPACPTS
ncbi:MAG: acylneuraminate cytidylyltransferase [Candidatus Omnitrophica bacterium CG11_big_fil_rev_8_21_14_0_20_63_9]|nr:MAG: acylneuraminate cytidylyltransferase [Candidatus Omnitrophica bacterium CG11_big_fil_rev_8_21_14_0_20_63_9]